MSLTTPVGRAPLEPVGRHTDVGLPEEITYWEPWPRRMRAILAGQTVLDSREGVMLWRTGSFPVLCFPRSDFRNDRFDETLLRAVSVRSSTAEGDLDGYVTVDFGAMDRWFEEDDPIYAHPRDPYHRVDVRASSRHVTVAANERLVAESTRPKLLFETGNPPRFYLPFADVDLGVLELSETVSECPYKGDGQHWHLTIDGHRISDAAWSLPHPLAEGLPAAEHICFYPSKVALTVDGVRVAA